MEEEDIFFSSIGILRIERMKNDHTHRQERERKKQIECFRVKNIYMYKDKEFLLKIENKRKKILMCRMARRYAIKPVNAIYPPVNITVIRN